MDINKLYRYAKCYLCGRQYPEVTLNIEGYIHHGEKFRCLDTKDCQRAAKKLSRQKLRQLHPLRKRWDAINRAWNYNPAQERHEMNTSWLIFSILAIIISLSSMFITIKSNIKSQRAVFADSSRASHISDTAKVCHYCDTAAKSGGAGSGVTGSGTVGHEARFEIGNSLSTPCTFYFPGAHPNYVLDVRTGKLRKIAPGENQGSLIYCTQQPHVGERKCQP